MQQPLIPPEYMATSEFLEWNEAFIDKYVLKRVMGIHQKRAIRDVFGAINDDNNVLLRAAFLESTDVYQRKFDAKLASISMTELWRARKAVNRLLELAESPYEKANVRLGAMKELNVIFGITEVDEKGNTKKGMSLDDFYKVHGQRRDLPQQESSDNPRGHTEPAKPASPLH